MIAVDRGSFPSIEKKLMAFLSEKLTGLHLETISTIDDRISLNYQYKRRADFDWPAFINELNQLAGTSGIEVFVS